MNLLPWKTMYDNKVFNLQETVETEISREHLIPVLRWFNYIVEKTRNIKYNENIEPLICVQPNVLYIDLNKMCTFLLKEENNAIYGKTPQTILNILYNKEVLNNVMCTFEEEEKFLKETKYDLDLTYCNSLGELGEKLFQLIDEKIFYSPFTYLLQNLFPFVFQIYLLQNTNVDETDKTEIQNNRLGTYIKFWLSIEKDKEIITTDPVLRRVFNRDIRYETFKKLHVFYSKNRICYVRDYNRRLPFSTERLENFIEKNFINNPNPNVVNDLVNMLKEILIDKFPQYQHFVNEMTGFLFIQSMFVTDESSSPTNIDYITFSCFTKLQAYMKNDRNVINILKKITSMIEFTPGKFIDTSIFHGWMQNEYTAEIINTLMQIKDDLNKIKYRKKIITKYIN